MFDDIPRPTCRSVYTVSDKRLRHGGSGYETRLGCPGLHGVCIIFYACIHGLKKLLRFT